MRSIASVVVFAAAFAGVLSMDAPAQAQPNGSYLQTCRNVRVLGESGLAPLLTAQCQSSGGNWIQSSLFYRRCRGDIFNENGRLRCEGGGSGDIGGLPSGTWRQSCRDGYVDGRTLYAECQRSNGRWRQSSLSLQPCPRGPVGNNNGNLYCEGSGGSAGLPSGSWRQSCQDGYVDRGTLYAECQRSNGRWRESSLSLRACPRGPVGNNDGNLFCEGGSGGNAGLPTGSWRQSCRNGTVDGRTLYAECQRNNGRWQNASLNLQACPRGPVGNKNGSLFCEGIAGGRVRLTLFQDFNFGGRVLRLTGPAPDLRDYGFDDLASSLRSEGTWYVCSKVNYSGECTTVGREVNLNSKWNKKISSARPGP